MPNHGHQSVELVTGDHRRRHPSVALQWSMAVLGPGRRRDAGVFWQTPEVLFPCVRDPEAFAALHGLCSPCATQPLSFGLFERSVLLLQSGTYELGITHRTDSARSSPSFIRSPSPVYGDPSRLPKFVRTGFCRLTMVAIFDGHGGGGGGGGGQGRRGADR